MSTQSATRTRENVRIREPKKYRVIMHNDDFTTMEFVVSILIDIFKKSPADAEALMLQVHHNGRAAVGIYPYDIACTKVSLALTRAKEENFPFRMTIEEE
ncbi:MAG: ATP-dependent Clp protease adaptor ClpS [Clostridia bacterium]|nr:ATP-dependent Clp protease adaptor ClpS [Clostridia bacterium]